MYSTPTQVAPSLAFVALPEPIYTDIGSQRAASLYGPSSGQPGAAGPGRAMPWSRPCYA